LLICTFFIFLFPLIIMATSSHDVDPSARFITPNGLPLAVIVLSCIFLFISIVTVGLRTFIRLKKGIYSLDDAFMTIGTVCLRSNTMARSSLLILHLDCVYSSHWIGDIRVLDRPRKNEHRTQCMADIYVH
jgi:hypothetical protein